MIRLFDTNISPKAIKEVTRTLKSGYLNMGSKTKLFEQRLERELGLENAVATNSCTAALHMALILAGVGPGDEVILPAQTFIATGIVVKLVGATPVFVDIELETGNISPRSIQESITARTKAIIVVHWGGYPCKLSPILHLAYQYNIRVIEDAAQALGATYLRHPIGSISDYTCFSFQAIKMLTTADGGILCCKRPDDYARAKRLRWFGADKETMRNNEVGARMFNLHEAGFKYHMNDFTASLGLGGLDDFKARLSQAADIAWHYGCEFFEHEKARPLLQALNGGSNWFFSMWVDSPKDFIEFMKVRRIESGVVDLRIDQQPLFNGGANLPHQELFNQHHVALPTHSGLSVGNVQHIVDSVKEYENAVR
jgi:perosamine synthetase